ncbi:hypothetical protein KY290_007151 [Solanum tuberosum]|uniref:Uncharacterized protein n=1 Tax=Solanum tuberosum TaxID=4113 RepID=A0ABQ7W6V6_SOLTU|nr:hypothetical protein KY290_007151 [Solanum tuberosum]
MNIKLRTQILKSLPLNLFSQIFQDFQEISGSIAKSQINQQEGMSKSSNTPFKMKEVMHVAKSKGKTKNLDKHKEDKSVDVLTSKKKRKVKEIASTSNKQDKSVDILISKKKRKGKDIASISNKENAQSDSVEQLHFGRIEIFNLEYNLFSRKIHFTPHMQCYTNIGVMDQAETISDSEAPAKPIRSNVDVDSSERITIT